MHKYSKLKILSKAIAKARKYVRASLSACAPVQWCAIVKLHWPIAPADAKR